MTQCVKQYTPTHEWIQWDSDSPGELVKVGISEHAQSALGDIVYVELPSVGDVFQQGEEAAVVESVKAAADVYAPVSGTVIEINSALMDHPERINHAAESDGWMFTLKLSQPSEVENLLSSEGYHATLEDH
jgi:glycine cleavage system H protein